MNIHRNTSRLGSSLILASLPIQPLSVEAQCSSNTQTSTGVTGMGMKFNHVVKYLGGFKSCSSTMWMGSTTMDWMTMDSFYCYPTSPTTTQHVSATAFTTAPSPSCGWVCTACGPAGTVTIDKSDGLPVQLLEFGIGHAGGGAQ